MSRVSDQPVNVYAVVQSDSTIFDPPARGLIALVWVASDTIAIKRPDGTTVAIALPDPAAGGSMPWRLDCDIRQVLATGTSLEDAEMLLLK